MFAPPLPHNTSHVTTPPLPHSPRPTSRNYQRVVTSDHPPAATPFLLKKKKISLPHTETSHVNTPLPHSPSPTSRIYRRFVTSRRPPAGTPFLLKKNIYKKTAKPIIFHPRAGGPEGIRASDLKAPYQNCLVVQRPAKRLFVPPYLPPRAGFSPPYVSTPPPPHPL